MLSLFLVTMTLTRIGSSSLHLLKTMTYQVTAWKYFNMGGILKSWNRQLTEKRIKFSFHTVCGMAIFSALIHRRQPQNGECDVECQGEGESLESETSPQVWRNCSVWNINAPPHPFFYLPSTSCHSHCNNHLSPLSPSHAFLIVHPPSALFSLSYPRLSPVILFIPFFLPFCCGFPSIQVHTSQVSARPYTPLPSLREVAVVTGRMDDRQGLVPLSSSSPLWNTTHIQPAVC